MTNPNHKPKLSIVVAISQNNAIGKDNDLLWHISDDLKRFKAITSGHTVIMGRNTWNSLPRRPLPKRRNIVLSQNPDFNPEGAEVARSINEVLRLVDGEDESFIIGGAAVYKAFMPFVNRIFVTWVYRDFDADVYFPTIDHSVFHEVNSSERFFDVSSGLYYSYAEYHRLPHSHILL